MQIKDGHVTHYEFNFQHISVQVEDFGQEKG